MRSSERSVRRRSGQLVGLEVHETLRILRDGLEREPRTDWSHCHHYDSLTLTGSDFLSRTHPTISRRIQIEANVSTFHILSGSLSSLFICLQLSQVHMVLFLPHNMQMKATRGCAFKTVCFINSGIACSDVHALGWSAGMNPGVSRDRVSGEGAQLQKRELDLWPMVAATRASAHVTTEAAFWCITRSASPLHPCCCLNLPLPPIITIWTAFMVAHYLFSLLRLVRALVKNKQFP